MTAPNDLRDFLWIVSSQWQTFLYILLCLAVLANIYPLLVRPSFPSNAPPMVMRHWPLVGCPRFFAERARFCLEGKVASRTGSFSFYFGRYPVVQVAGPAGRKAFFDSRGMHLTLGNLALLSGRPPLPKGYVPPSSAKSSSPVFFATNLKRLMREEVLCRSLPLAQRDAAAEVRELAQRCGEGDGRLSPFDDMYRVVFRISVRIVGAVEISDDPQLFDDFVKSLQAIAETASASAVIFPLLPSLNMLRSLGAGMRLYRLITKVKNDRVLTGRRHDDALQMLIDDGAENVDILKFIIGSLFASVQNTVLATAQTFVYLATNPEWYRKVQQEVDSTLCHYRQGEEKTFETVQRLSLNIFFHRFPIINACIDETIRFTMPTAGFRKNVSGQDIPIGDTEHVIPREAYAFAKMEMTLIIILFIAAFDFEAMDQNGRRFVRQPSVDRNGVVPEIDKSVNLKYHLRRRYGTLM
ncbi:hypothetical protein PspLS_10790 [Pyricularia sp. CBS 133598]|nr:hypothetical protein PspLS_10790 [Pyricularia sp. CBS 133598]